MLATKEQERKALEKIRKIVEELGEDSYLATAFDGCFEDAEQNIDNDFALSWKNRAEARQRRVDELNQIVEDLTDKNAVMKNDISFLKSQVLDMQDMVFLKNIANDWAAEEEHLADEAADQIIAMAENPLTDAFKEAVKTNRSRNFRAVHAYEVVKHLEERITGKH